jgi:hypothetical protein
MIVVDNTVFSQISSKVVGFLSLYMPKYDIHGGMCYTFYLRNRHSQVNEGGREGRTDIEK